jgi:hypothetical protein
MANTAYTIRDIPSDLWRQVKSQAALEGVTIRQFILDALTERTSQENIMYPIIIAGIGEHDIMELDRLSPVTTLAEAKAIAKEEGYTVIDNGCETNDTWEPDKNETVHIVAVEMPD